MNDPTSRRLAPYFEAFIEGQIAPRKYEDATEVIEEGSDYLKRARQARSTVPGLQRGSTAARPWTSA